MKYRTALKELISFLAERTGLAEATLYRMLLDLPLMYVIVYADSVERMRQDGYRDAWIGAQLISELLDVFRHLEERTEGSKLMNYLEPYG